MAHQDWEAFKSDDEVMSILVRAMRGQVALSLLVGNDTQCFTTEQYKKSYENKYAKYIVGIPQSALWAHISPRDHLLSIPDTVKEVSPDVWAKV